MPKNPPRSAAASSAASRAASRSAARSSRKSAPAVIPRTTTGADEACEHAYEDNVDVDADVDALGAAVTSARMDSYARDAASVPAGVASLLVVLAVVEYDDARRANARARVDGKVEDVDADVASARAGVAGVAGVIFPAIARPSANASEDAARRVVIASNASNASNASCSRAPASLANASEDARRRARSGSARRDATSRETLLRKDHRHCLYIRRVDTTARNPARARPSLVVAVARANDPPRAVRRASVHARVRRLERVLARPSRAPRSLETRAARAI